MVGQVPVTGAGRRPTTSGPIGSRPRPVPPHRPGRLRSGAHCRDGATGV